MTRPVEHFVEEAARSSRRRPGRRSLLVDCALLAGCVVLCVPISAPAAAQPMPALQIQEMPPHPELVAAKALIEDERWYDAFGKLAELAPTLAPDDSNRAETFFALGQVMFNLGLYQSALRSFDAATVPESHQLYRQKMRYYLQIQQKVPGDLASMERLSDAPETLHGKEMVDEVRFLLGRYYYGVGDHKKAIDKLSAVKPDAGETYLKSRYLLGVLFVVLNQAQPALEAFKDILRFEELVGRPSYFLPYQQMAYMSLGRLFYSIGQFETAGRYYDRVEEGTSSWLDSLFELGWTYFQMGRIDRVLGQLHTLNSPYFEDRYYPEARVLESLILFRTCRFNETLVTVQKFLRDYKPLKKELDAQLAGNRSDAEFYDYLFQLSRNKEELSVQLRRIFNAALSDKRVQRAFAQVVQADQELHGLEKLIRNTSATEAAKAVHEDMGRVRAVMVAEAGGLARQRLSRVREELTEIIRQGLRIKYETLKGRRNSISDQVRRDMAETAKAVSEPRADDTEHIVWPFDGSYWRDELGGYTYDTGSRCESKHLPKGAAAAPAPKGLKARPDPQAAEAADGESSAPTNPEGR